MRLLSFLIACLVLLAGGLSGTISPSLALNESSSLNQPDSVSQTAPSIANARLKGKKLFVSGEGFTNGTEILVDGQRVKTVNDPDNPATLLIAKKAGKSIPVESIVSLSVHTPEGATSEPLGFFPGLTVTLDYTGKVLQLSVGQRFVLALVKGDYEWAPTVLNTAVVQKVADAEAVKGAQGLYEAVAVGDTRLQAIGDLPCSKFEPPCPVPSYWFDLEIDVR
jgi:hypothetical protein